MEAEKKSVEEFYNCLDGSLDEAWRLLGDGASNRHSAFHTPVFLTNGIDGFPQARTVVLRRADRYSNMVQFNADLRSEKVAQIARDRRVGLVFYSAGDKIQLRLNGAATMHSGDLVAESAWSNMAEKSRVCYRIAPGPGAPLSCPEETTHVDRLPDGSGGRDMFCTVRVVITSLEWLFLDFRGHRRARFDYVGETVRGQWCVP